ncbi:MULTISPECIES: helix-turn-helix domain-containing protein [Stakelama]|uniref:Helix-turn-helix domain-containing protein n=2 Tax=Stakelama TaxID=1124625 RepID=A0A8T4IDW8_9SPHN|nr:MULTISPECIES: helix-turn-helix domain-containing protein [Stakelama]MAW99936.1 excisionase [Sphingomonas sp.]MBR0552760.1 helix-turn-helix domain-containing protein [Stakelama marina]|tara:strand:+ start:96 stop:314 length:219 start_codon:yes stop_codon:yes gene_type:complete
MSGSIDSSCVPDRDRLDTPICVRADRAAQMLGIGKTKLYELIGSGELELVHIGRRSLILKSSIDDFVARLRA